MELLSSGISLFVLLIGIVVFVLPFIVYLLTAHNTLRAVSPQNRKMKPGQVWLMLVPFFGYFWLFRIVDAVSASTRTELAGFGLPQTETMRTAGLGWAIFLIAGLFFGFLYLVSYISFAWHWIEVNKARRLILTMKEVTQQSDDSSIFK